MLSDEFGCGAAFLLASELFGAATIIDLETAVANGWIATLAPKSRRPDYVARLPAGGLVILEAKGTQSGASYARDRQLTSACLQIAAVRVSGPSAPQIDARVASALSLSFEHWGPYTEAFEATQMKRVLSCMNSGKALPPSRSAIITLVSPHSSAIENLLVDFAEPLSAPTLPMSHRTLDGTSYLGTELTFEGGGRLRFFVGLDARFRQSLLESSFEATLALLPSRGAKLIYDRDILSTGEHAPQDRVSVQAEALAAAPDGTVWITTLER